MVMKCMCLDFVYLKQGRRTNKQNMNLVKQGKDVFSQVIAIFAHICL